MFWKSESTDLLMDWKWEERRIRIRITGQPEHLGEWWDRHWEGGCWGRLHFGSVGAGVQSGNNWEMLVILGGNQMNYFRVVERSQGGVIPLAVVSLEIILKARWLTEISKGWVWLAYNRGLIQEESQEGWYATDKWRMRGTINSVNCRAR